eukprot:CAMPEP_0196586898 /NCGR_PEP_ID=MMETSP1081-20130531/55877_1 /TAXON_ID=36882 /ORGANISM="Pyramimonas amylifera, Strain CCMP720" /LENGTH=338 /DNA_ID=CAMNT_0041908919 /DNA_START=125 /DNA_END=1141 /DNA_ORIENTATION=-
MSGKFTGFLVNEKGGKLVKGEYAPPPLGERDIDIAVTHNGLCHTDCHMRDNEWGVTQYPFVPGHEVVGTVKAIGKLVTQFKVGERVGYAWIKDSCGSCRNCVKGEENICVAGYTGLITMGGNGGFQPVMRAPAAFAFKIPDALDSVSAAPLLCAGITVYSPLKAHMNRPGMKVGVIGVGGLGHMAVKFAAAMGAEVYAISTSPDKEAECKKMGADHFVVSSEAETKLSSTLDLIINTVSAKNDYTKQLTMLANDGTLCLVGLPVEDVVIPVTGLVFFQKKVVGSIVGGRKDMIEMLELAAVKQIKPTCETMPLSQVNEAMAKVEANKARYRIVLTTDI